MTAWACIAHNLVGGIHQYEQIPVKADVRIDMIPTTKVRCLGRSRRLNGRSRADPEAAGPHCLFRLIENCGLSTRSTVSPIEPLASGVPATSKQSIAECAQMQRGRSPRLSSTAISVRDLQPVQEQATRR